MSAAASPPLAPKPAAPWRVALGAVVFAFFLAHPQPGFDGLVPDNITQTAYWTVLLRPELAGSIGSSAAKPGLIVLLGLTNDLAIATGSPWPFRLLLAGFATALVLLAGLLAERVGGVVAGLLAVIVLLHDPWLAQVYYVGGSSLFFLPPVLLGLLLATRGRDGAAVAALAAAATLRIEALGMAGSLLALRGVRRRRWRLVASGATMCAVVVVLAAAVPWLIHGEWGRTGGAAASGYPLPASLTTPAQLHDVLARLLAEPGVRLFLLPALLACFVRDSARTCLHYLAGMVILGAAVAAGLAGLEYRFVAPLQVLVIALGAGGLMVAVARPVDAPLLGRARASAAASIAAVLVVAAAWLTGEPDTAAWMLGLPAAALLLRLADRHSPLRLYGLLRLAPALVAAVALLGPGARMRTQLAAMEASGAVRESVLDGREFLASPVVPSGARVLGEDEMLAWVLAREPSRIGDALSLARFNVLTEAGRRAWLAGGGFLYVSLRANHGWNYLAFLPVPGWQADPFRQAVLAMLQGGEAQALKSARLLPIHRDGTRLVARVDPVTP